jgi:cardiolipin synthase
MMTIDGRFSFVGTPNFDARSLKLNFEVGAAIYDPRITLELDEIFDRTLKQSQSIDLETWRSRSIQARILQNFARLFSPIL